MSDTSTTETSFPTQPPLEASLTPAEISADLIAVPSPQTFNLAPNLGDAERFLSAIAPDGFLTLQTLPESEEAEAHPKANFVFNKIRFGKFAKHAAYLSKLNDSGAGIFFMVNRGNGKGRKAENVQSIRAVFVDLDGAPLEPVLKAAIPPSITVESSPGRYHAYWLARDMPLGDFKPAQQALAKMFDGDKAVCDSTRLMRIPGFMHRKTSTPFQSRLMTCESEMVWDWLILADALGLPRQMRLADRILEGERNSTLFKMATNGAKTGIPKESQLDRLRTINVERCEPPLPDAELEGIVDRAYRCSSEGLLLIPLKLLADERFLDLEPGPKALLMLSYQRIAAKRLAQFPLLWTDFKAHFPRENTFKSYRKDLVKSELLLVARKAPRFKGVGKPQANFYTLAITEGV